MCALKCSKIVAEGHLIIKSAETFHFEVNIILANVICFSSYQEYEGRIFGPKGF